MFHIIYKTTRISTGEYYIGIHSSNKLMDSYLGSGDRIRALVRKYGRQEFIRENLLVLNTRRDALQKEHEILSPEVLSDPLCINICVGGKGNPNGGHGISQDAKAKLSILHTGKKLSDRTKQRISKSKTGQPSKLKGRTRPLDVVIRIRQQNTGKLRSAQTKQLISIARMGKPRTDETKQKLREYKRGQKHSLESLIKMRKPKTKVSCPWCGQEGGISQMKRWHFDQCKVKPM